MKIRSLSRTTTCAVAAALLCHFGAQAKPSVQDQLAEEIYKVSDADDAASIQRIEGLLGKGAKLVVKGDGMQPLHLAVDRGRADVVELFIRKKVNIDTPLQKGDPETALMYTAAKSPSQPDGRAARRRIINLLLDAGANPNVRNRLGDTPLALAAGEGQLAPDLPLVDKLLQKGADPKARSDGGYTILMGRPAGNLAVLKRLIAAGADPYAVAENGNTPLHQVCAISHEQEFAQTDKPALRDPDAAARIALLTKPGTDINAYPPRSQVTNPLGANIGTPNPDCISALIKAGARPNAVIRDPATAEEDKGITALQYARKYEHVKPSVKQVLEAAARAK